MVAQDQSRSNVPMARGWKQLKRHAHSKSQAQQRKRDAICMDSILPIAALILPTVASYLLPTQSRELLSAMRLEPL
eukprot:1928346-Amphidinium_carterae.1